MPNTGPLESNFTLNSTHILIDDTPFHTSIEVEILIDNTNKNTIIASQENELEQPKEAPVPTPNIDAPTKPPPSPSKSPYAKRQRYSDDKTKTPQKQSLNLSDFSSDSEDEQDKDVTTSPIRTRSKIPVHSPPTKSRLPTRRRVATIIQRFEKTAVEGEGSGKEVQQHASQQQQQQQNEKQPGFAPPDSRFMIMPSLPGVDPSFVKDSPVREDIEQSLKRRLRLLGPSKVGGAVQPGGEESEKENDGDAASGVREEDIGNAEQAAHYPAASPAEDVPEFMRSETEEEERRQPLREVKTDDETTSEHSTEVTNTEEEDRPTTPTDIFNQPPTPPTLTSPEPKPRPTPRRTDDLRKRVLKRAFSQERTRSPVRKGVSSAAGVLATPPGVRTVPFLKRVESALEADGLNDDDDGDSDDEVNVVTSPSKNSRTPVLPFGSTPSPQQQNVSSSTWSSPSPTTSYASRKAERERVRKAVREGMRGGDGVGKRVLGWVLTVAFWCVPMLLVLLVVGNEEVLGRLRGFLEGWEGGEVLREGYARGVEIVLRVWEKSAEVVTGMFERGLEVASVGTKDVRDVVLPVFEKFQRDVAGWDLGEYVEEWGGMVRSEVYRVVETIIPPVLETFETIRKFTIPSNDEWRAHASSLERYITTNPIQTLSFLLLTLFTTYTFYTLHRKYTRTRLIHSTIQKVVLLTEVWDADQVVLVERIRDAVLKPGSLEDGERERVWERVRKGVVEGGVVKEGSWVFDGVEGVYWGRG
ncbi:hypothetical protein HDV00_006449 [Rhizophlyctis rosea]|nr:hypothetical protein HDV00_006449 [Rhizophlyctis rosea]